MPRSAVGQAGRLVVTAAAVLVAWVLVALARIGPDYGREHRAATALGWGARLALRAVGVRRAVTGRPRSGAGLVVGNHVSWLDLLILLSCTPIRPVSKHEVDAWPVVGSLGRSVGRIPIRRDDWRELPDLVDRMAAALRAGHKVQIFPEGTTRCGGAVDEFRRAGFQAAIDAGVTVLPVAVSYHDRFGRQTAGPAFVGDETVLASLLRVVRQGPVVARVDWLTPIPARVGAGHRSRDRANVARDAELAVAGALGQPVLPRTDGPGTRQVHHAGAVGPDVEGAVEPKPVVAVEAPAGHR